jgi:hypothetical protein
MSLRAAAALAVKLYKTWLLRFVLSLRRLSVQYHVNALQRKGELLSFPAAAASAAQLQDKFFGDGRAAVRFVNHAAFASALCEGAPAKRDACEHFPPLLLGRLGYKTWLLATTLLWFVSSLTRLLVQRFVKALRRRGKLVGLPAAAASVALLQDVAFGQRRPSTSRSVSCSTRRPCVLISLKAGGSSWTGFGP